jgi:hypothetical protein
MTERRVEPKRAAKHETETRWLDENRTFLEENYAGKWVAVKGAELVAAGETFGEALDRAQALGASDPVVDSVRSKEYQHVILIRGCRRTLNSSFLCSTADHFGPRTRANDRDFRRREGAN